jgi:hypothetical protein
MLNAYRCLLYEGGGFFSAEDCRRPTTFSSELVGTVARSLLAQIRRGEEPDTILSNFLVVHHKLRVVDEASLLALEDLLADYSLCPLFNTTAAEQNEDEDVPGGR